MKLTVHQLKTLIKEALDIDPKTRWPWIDHFDATNEEGMEHPGNWVKPTMDDFMQAINKMDPKEFEALVRNAFVSLGKSGGRYHHDGTYATVDWKRSPTVKKAMFDSWEKQEFWKHRDFQNKYFAAARDRDRKAHDKAMEDPVTRRMLRLRVSRDNAEILGKPWFPPKE